MYRARDAVDLSGNYVHAVEVLRRVMETRIRLYLRVNRQLFFH